MIALVSVLFSNPALADKPQLFQTTWEFRSYSEDIPITNYDTMSDERVIMPSGSNWICTKRPVSSFSGFLIGSFGCYSGDVFIQIEAWCSPNKIDDGTGHAKIQNTNVNPLERKTITFTVICKTTKK